MPESPELAVIIVSYNTRDLLLSCLTSVRAATGGLKAEVIVADNDSKDGSAAMVEEKFPEVCLLRSGSNLGYAKANNLAARQATSPNLLFLNPDAALKSEDLAHLLEYSAEHPRAGIHGCRVRMLDGSVQEDGAGHFLSFGRWFALRFRLDRLIPDLGLFTARRRSVSGPVDWVSGVCLLIRRNVFFELGGFDEGMFAYYEDMDLCRRAAKVGVACHYVIEAGVLHAKGAAFGQDRIQQVRCGQESELHYISKHWPRRAFSVYRFTSTAFQRIKLAGALVTRDRARQDEARTRLAVIKGKAGRTGC